MSDDYDPYTNRTKIYRYAIAAILKREELALEAIDKEPGTASRRRLVLVDDMLALASNYIVLSGISESMLKQRNEEALNEARKTIYKALIYLETLVSAKVDAPYAEYEDLVERIADVSAAARFTLSRKLGLTVQLLEGAYGDNTKWKWSFVEIEGRCAAGVKNLLDMKRMVAATDPRSADYEPVTRHLALAKRLLNQAGDRYRDKYEIATRATDDLRLAINFAGALRRLHILLGEAGEAEAMKRKQDAWQARLEAEFRKKDEAEAQPPGQANG